MLHELASHIRPLAVPVDLRPDGAQAGVVLLHGFADSPYSMRDLARFIADAGFAVSVPRLPGHGVRIEDFARSSANDWREAVHDALQAMRASYGRVAVVGRSFGGVLAILELLEHQHAADSLVCIATPAEARNQAFLRYALPVVALFMKTLKKPWMKPEEYVMRLEVGRYDRFALPALKEFFAVMRRFTASDLQHLSLPALLVHGDSDPIVASKNLALLSQRLVGAQKKTLLLRGVPHEPSVVHSNPEFQSALLDFLRSTLAPDAPLREG